MKHITIGTATIDIIMQIAPHDVERMTMHNTNISFMMLQLGQKMDATSIDVSVGGGAVNASICMARLGQQVYPIVKLKQDVNGKKVLQWLEQDNIDRSYILCDATQPTATSVLLSSVERDPTIFTHRGANTQLTVDCINASAVDDADVVYITALSGESAKIFPDLVKKVHGDTRFVATNPGILQIRRYGADIIEHIPYIDCLTMNSHEASEMIGHLYHNVCDKAQLVVNDAYAHADKMSVLKTGLSTQNHHMSLARFMNTMCHFGLKYMVVTDGKNGAYMGTKDGVYFSPSIRTKVNGTIGAGDAFASTLVTFLADSTKTDQQALAAGALNSASVVSYVDTQQGLLDTDALNSRITADVLNDIIFMPYVE